VHKGKPHKRWVLQVMHSKKTYFQNRAPTVSFQNRITSHLPGIQVQIHHVVRKGIMDIVTGEMYFEPNEEGDNNLEETCKEKALSISRKLKIFQSCIILS
jgi:hypothetical protein